MPVPRDLRTDSGSRHSHRTPQAIDGRTESIHKPPLGLTVQRHGDDLRLVTAPEVTASVERHLSHPRPVALSQAALEVLAIVAYRQPIARSGIELIRGTASDSAIGNLIERGLIEHNPHHLYVTTRAFLELAGVSDLADLPQLGLIEQFELT